MSRLEQNLKHAMNLSQEIHRLATDKQWPEMAKLDRERIELLEAVFADPELSVNKGYQEQVQQILALNDKVISLCGEAREALMRDGRRLKLGREAVKAYRKQSRE